MGSDTTVAVFNNAVWGGGKNSSGGATCAPSTGPVFYGPANLNVSNYFPNTPAPCPFATQPSSYNVTTAVYTGSPGTYSLAGVDGVTPVPHFLDFGRRAAARARARVGVAAAAAALLSPCSAAL